MAKAASRKVKYFSTQKLFVPSIDQKFQPLSEILKAKEQRKNYRSWEEELPISENISIAEKELLDLLDKCELRLLDAQFKKEPEDGRAVRTFYKDFKEVDLLGKRQRIKVAIWEGCLQVDRFVVNKNGSEKYSKTLIWGWRLNAVDDINLVLEKQVDLFYLSAKNA